MLGVLVLGRIGHNDAGVLVQDNQRILVAIPVSGIIGSQDDVVGRKGFSEAGGSESLVLDVFVRRCSGWFAFGLSSTRCVLNHSASTDLAVRVFGCVRNVMIRVDWCTNTARQCT